MQQEYHSPFVLIDGKNKLDWRGLLCRLRVLIFPEETPQQHLEWAFYCYTEDKRRNKHSDPTLSTTEAFFLFTLFVGTEGCEREIYRLVQKAYDSLPEVQH